MVHPSRVLRTAAAAYPAQYGYTVPIQLDGIASGRSRVVLAVDRLPATLPNRLGRLDRLMLVHKETLEQESRRCCSTFFQSVDELLDRKPNLLTKREETPVTRDEVLKRILKMKPKPLIRTAKQSRSKPKKSGTAKD